EQDGKLAVGKTDEIKSVHPSILRRSSGQARLRTNGFYFIRLSVPARAMFGFASLNTAFSIKNSYKKPQDYGG
ncbi:MAG: hypothetical protein WC091_19110, partial [Sulfuricellaceae bacterium]